MTRDNCFVCGEDIHISEAYQLQIGKLDHQNIWLCVWCIDSQLDGGSDFRVTKILEKGRIQSEVDYTIAVGGWVS